MKALSLLPSCTLLLALTVVAACEDSPASAPPDASAGSDAGVNTIDSSDATGDANPLLPLDCLTLDQFAQGFETQPVTSSFSTEAAPRTPSGTERNITPHRIYQRTHVAQYRGTADVDPPLPTLIAFSFDADSNQLSGEYCVVQATKGKDGGPSLGHYQISFVPRSPGSTTDFVVSATMKGPNGGKFPIGFDGNALELTIYVKDGSTTYLETYVAR